MIRVRWQEPGDRLFHCKYLDADGVPAEELREGESVEAVKATFAQDIAAKKITSLTSVAPYDWAGWKKRSVSATAAIVVEPEAGKSRSFRSQVWADLKLYLSFLFRGKCAYCEASFVEVSWGDVEHYRPKSDVSDLDGTAVAGHPGYYWLAYDPTNLMPSCEKCNRALAKMTRFPVADPARRTREPGKPLTDEDPLFISPYEDTLDPRVHFSFETTHGTAPGLVKPLTPRAEASIKGYHLNRRPLIDARQRAQETVIAQILKILAKADSLKKEKKAYASGLVPFSAAMLSEFEDWERRTEFSVPL